MEFSPDGTLLLTVSMDDDSTLILFDWLSVRVVATCKVDKNGINCISWKNNKEFASCGYNHIKFHKIEGRNILQQYASCEETVESMESILFTYTSDCISGSSNGNLFVYKHMQGQTYKILKPLKGHDGKITCLATGKNAIFSAGQDSKILVWQLANG